MTGPVVAAVVPDHLASRIDGEKEAEVLRRSVGFPPVDAEERRARFHPVRLTGRDLEWWKVVWEGIGLDDQRWRAVAVAGGVGGDEGHLVSAAGPEPHDRHGVLRAIGVVDRDVVDACPVGDLDRQTCGLVGGQLDPDTQGGFRPRRLGDPELRDRRWRAICAGRREERNRREAREDSRRRHDAT